MVELKGYEIAENLQEGSRFNLYRAHREDDGVPCIVKTLPGSALASRDAASLRHEYEVTGDLALSGVVRPLSLERLEGRPVLILEDPGGVPFDRLIGDPALDLAAVCRVGARLAGILGTVHERGIIHKDVRPSNILVDLDSGGVWLTGLGNSARLQRERSSAAAPELLEGSLEYMAPEQTGRMNRMVDQRTDFYSLGVTLYEAAVGRRPFEVEDPMELVHCHIARQPVPPAERAPQVPEALSRVLLRLMAKTAEDRYQTASGIEVDLLECASGLARGDGLEDFEPGRHDVSDRFQIPDKLYAREAAAADLLAAFDRAARGRPELVLVSGFPGIGKSALVGELNRPIVARRGYFASGKFDQFRRDIPYSAIIQAFRDLVRTLLTESEDRLVGWRASLGAALESSGQVIVDVIPEVELIIGPQPAIPELGLSEAQARFRRVFRHFVRALTTAERPLCLFVDDLQWADGATLDLIRLMMTDRASQHLLVVGAYRHEEVTPGGQLLSLIARLEEEGAPVTDIQLDPLAEQDVAALLADTMRTEARACREFAEVVVAKTGGNPFFVREFLRVLHDRELLRFDRARQRWSWDLEEIRRVGVTDNVVDLVTARISDLPAETVAVVQLAACVGAEFDLRTVARVNQSTQVVTSARLAPALRADLLVPLDEAYKYADFMEDSQNGSTASIRYQFVHDRVQQAAYATVDPDERRKLHCRIGGQLQSEAAEEDLTERIFDIVNHLNECRELVTTPAKRVELAQLNLTASERAKRSMALAPAAKYVALGLELIGPEGWSEQYDLALGLHLEQSEIAYLSGDFELMDTTGDVILDKARSVLDAVPVYELRIQRYHDEIRYPEAVDTGLRVLALLGDPLPARPGKAAVAVGLARTVALLRGRNVASLLDLPAMADQSKLATMRILMAIASGAYYVHADLFPLIVFKMVQLSVRYGNSPLSAFGYGCYGLIFCGVVGLVDRGYAFGRLSLDVVDRFEAEDLRAKTAHLFNLFVRHWKEDLRDTLDHLLEGASKGMENGDYEYASYCKLFYSSHCFFTGEPLDRLSAKVTVHYESAVRVKQDKASGLLLLLCDNLRALRTRPDAPEPAGLPDADLAPYLERWESVRDRVSLSYAHVFGIMRNYLLGAPEQAVDHARRLVPYEDNLAGQSYLPFARHYESLALLALIPGLEGADRRLALRKVAKNQRRLRRWSRWAPMNYARWHALVDAERTRVEGDAWEAVRLFEYGIALAREAESLPDEALGEELIGRLYLSLGDPQAGAVHLATAIRLYGRWGADAKVGLLTEEFDELLERLAGLEAVRSRRRSGSAEGATDLDAHSVIKSAQAISREINVEELIRRVLAVAMENAGAQRGFFIVERGGALQIEAGASVDADLEAESVKQPVDETRLLSRAVVNLVARLKEDVVLGDAGADPRFQSDPYIQEQRPLSLLCVPVMRREELAAILYLENNRARDAFTPDRLAVLKTLTAQATISLQNAFLYENLEQQVEERTRDLELARAEADRQRQKADDLLFSILPGSVAEDLKAHGRFEPLRFDSATVLFSDFVSFTSYAQSMDPIHLVAELDRLFLRFDDICDLHRMEKIKTIGDSYMCAGGVPSPSATHAIDACLTALEIRDFMRVENDGEDGGGSPWQVRIGIHSGHVMAGVIGRTRPAFDVWGDAVNVASRMESAGVAGQVNLSKDTRDLVDPFFETRYRGRMEVKNRGELEMYFLEAIRPELATADDPSKPNDAFWQLADKVLGVRLAPDSDG
jgi:predicted ATPase/class 3 adenylate cyclase